MSQSDTKKYHPILERPMTREELKMVRDMADRLKDNPESIVYANLVYMLLDDIDRRMS